jgi:hypothetical protein
VQKEVGCKTSGRIERRVARFFLVQYTKTGNGYQIITKYTKVPQNIPKRPHNLPKDHKIYHKMLSMAIHIPTFFHSMVLKNIPELGFLVLKYTIRQPLWNSAFCSLEKYFRV